ncbi:uncharacterized protein METZ01_LOCUS336421, partial [marine metagenome]
MKKLIIILPFFCLFPFMALGKVVVTTDCSDDDIFCGLAIDKQLFRYAETNYPIPEPFGIKLGKKLDKDIIFEKEDDNEFYVNPKIKNNIFDEYYVRTKFNNVFSIRAYGYFYPDECPLRRDFLLIKLQEKYPEGGLYKDTWKFIQATKIVYNKDLVEWIEGFEIELSCNQYDNLTLYYKLHKGVP